MKSFIRIGSFACAILASFAIGFAQQEGTAAAPTEPTLKVGDAAPPISVVSWVKGNKVDKFEKGKVYVVEFWATWCGPCKVSIPHLTELAQKNKGKATFIGVSSFEHPAENIDQVKKFVTDMGAKMDYNVAADGAPGVMGKTWMEAAQQPGIPTAFIVNRDGKIAWIGHPMVGMDEVLDKVIANKFNMDDEAAKQAKAKLLNDLMQPVVGDIQKGDLKAAISKMDKIIADHPEFEADLGDTRYTFLLATDEPAAYDYAAKLSTGLYKNNAEKLNQMAWAIVDDQAQINNPNYDLAVKMAQRGLEVAKPTEIIHVYVADTLAYAYFKSGNLDKAISTEEKAVAEMAKFGDKIESATQKELKDRLAMFKAKKKG